MRIASDADDFAKFQRFLEDSPGCHFAQSPLWARVKAGWKYELVLSEGESGEIAGGAGALIRKLPVFGNIIYCPRGPVCGDDSRVLEDITSGLKELMGRYRAFAVIAEPDVLESDMEFRAGAQALGWRFGKVRDARDTIQPRSVFRVDLSGKTEEEVMAAFHKKLRYNIRLAQRRGVEVAEGGREDIEAFAGLMEVTARRDGFTARGREYYYRLWDALAPEHLTLLLARAQGELLAGGLFVHMGGKTWYLYGASGDEHRNLMPCHLMQWEAIRRAIQRRDRLYDLRGFLEITDETDPRGGLYRFKRQFGGDLVRLVCPMYLTDTPLKYALFQKSVRMYRAAEHYRASMRK